MRVARLKSGPLVDLSVGATQDGGVVASRAPRPQLTEAEVDIGTITVAGARRRPDGERRERRQGHARREPKQHGRVAFRHLLQGAAAQLFLLPTSKRC